MPDFHYDFHSHGVFTDYNKMYYFENQQTRFDLGLIDDIATQALKSVTISGIKNHGLPSTDYVGTLGHATNTATVSNYANRIGICSGTPELAYKIYDGQGDTNIGDITLQTALNMNEEFVANILFLSLISQR